MQQPIEPHITYDAPFGRIVMHYEVRPFLLVRVRFPADDGNAAGWSIPAEAIPEEACRIIDWFDHYFRKSSKPTPWDLLKTTGFTPLQQAVWAAAAQIGFGSVATYSEIARAIDRPRAARFVGNALGKNPFPILIPCHRVIRSDGGLGGFSAGLFVKKSLMAFESTVKHPMLAH